MPEASFSYRLVVCFFVFIRKIFFRDVIVRGSHKIPKNGPVIFVAAPHCNQFVDPLILISTCPRPIGFLMAAISLKRRIIGFFGKMLNSIPVERAQDYSQKCSGLVFVHPDDSSNTRLLGENTRFIDQFSSFFQKFDGNVNLLICFERETLTFPVSEVINDTELILKKPLSQNISDVLKISKLEFTIAPFIEQTDLYSSVFKQLSEQKCVGIFPEGGSHDRAEMLPLKAGVSIMALGYQSIHPESNLKIIPCGLHYFNAHRFRSRAVVEFGEAFEVPPNLIHDFLIGGEQKRISTLNFLKMISDSLKAITVNVPDIETLRVIQVARRLYRSDESHKKPDLQVELNRRFVKGYMKYKEDPRIIQLRQSIIDYNNLLIAFGIKDHQVKCTEISTIYSTFQLFYHISILIVFGLISLPGFLINSPALYFIGRISKSKARAAKKASKVKIHGNDVISTWKLLVALVLLPIIYGFYSCFLIYLNIHSMQLSLLKTFVFFWIFFYTLMIISYLTVRLSEMFLNSYHSIKPLILAMLNPHRCLILRQVRTSLREQINYVVDELGPSVVENFENSRIIKSSIDSNYSIPSSSSPLNQNLDPEFSSIELSSGRTSPIFDENMESIEQMLNHCKNLLSSKPKLE